LQFPKYIKKKSKKDQIVYFLISHFDSSGGWNLPTSKIIIVIPAKAGTSTPNHRLSSDSYRIQRKLEPHLNAQNKPLHFPVVDISLTNKVKNHPLLFPRRRWTLDE
jgi:hypothetical protein